MINYGPFKTRMTWGSFECLTTNGGGKGGGGDSLQQGSETAAEKLIKQSVGQSLAQLQKLKHNVGQNPKMYSKTEWAQAHSLERITEILSSRALRNFAADWF